ncbi:MAG: hypothetical protein QOD50_387, partial [Actinomycetota bacterium]|nr:hypothetical protein [Actinomycetota bacterium]
MSVPSPHRRANRATSPAPLPNRRTSQRTGEGFVRLVAGLAGRSILAGLVVAWLLVGSAAPGQADEGWVITSFHSDIAIAADSRLTVVEEIQVDFGSQSKHGIFRTIPLRYRYDSTHDRFYDLTVVSVTNGTSNIPYDESISSDNEVIKIGDPNRLVSGAQRYVITYTVAGAMNSFSDHDELFWNVDGALWPVSKQEVSATVIFPQGSFQASACYQGQPGSKDPCEKNDGTGSVTFTSTRKLGSGEEMSIVVALNKGAVTVPPPLLESRQRQFPQDAFELTPWTVGLFVLLTLAGIGLVGWNWWVHGRDRAYLTQHYLAPATAAGAPAEPERIQPLFAHDTLVVEFGPPQNMRPAELGLILDESADTKDVTATIVDLAVRGFLTITENQKKGDWTLTYKSGADEVLFPFEKTILDGMFAGRTTVKLSALKGTFAPTLKVAEKQMYADAVSRRLFTSSPDQARTAWGFLGCSVVLVGFAATAGLGLAFGWGFVGLAIVIVGIVLTASFPFMPQRTAAGRDLMQHTLGFRLYMNTAEKYRQQFA